MKFLTLIHLLINSSLRMNHTLSSNVFIFLSEPLIKNRHFEIDDKKFWMLCIFWHIIWHILKIAIINDWGIVLQIFLKMVWNGWNFKAGMFYVHKKAILYCECMWNNCKTYMNIRCIDIFTVISPFLHFKYNSICIIWKKKLLTRIFNGIRFHRYM